MTQKTHTHDHTSFVKFVSYSLFLLRSKTRQDRFGRTSSFVCFFFFLLLLLLLLLFLSLSSFLATYSSISRPSPLLLLSLNALPSPSFFVLVVPPLQFSTISSRLQDSIDEDTVHKLSFPCFPTEKNWNKNRKKYRKRHPNFFPSLVQCPYAFSFKYLQLRLCNNLLREMLASLDLRGYVALRSSRPLERGCLFAGRENKGWKRNPPPPSGKK